MCHWQPREQAAVKAIKALLEGGSDFSRIVDFGCGCADLEGAVRKIGLNYLGVDNNKFFVEQGQLRGTKEVACGDVTSLPSLLRTGDCLVLNGVVHHLCDSDIVEVFRQLPVIAGMIIVDHKKVAKVDDFFSFVNSLLQRLDRGRYIRAPQYFLEQFEVEQVSYSEFYIRIGGVPLWKFFGMALRNK